MSPEERDLIIQFVQRVGGQPAAGGFAGSVPATQPALPPVDREADALLGDLFARFPEARYRITQMAFVQEHALMEAQNRINRLEWELNNAKAAAAPPPASPWGQTAQAQPQQQGGLFGGLFGGRASPPPQAAPPPQYAAAPPPQPMYAPGYQPGMFQQPTGGSGFLGSALTTAAGVAGGMVAGNALMNLFSGGHSVYGGGFGGGYGGGFGGQPTTIVENFYGSEPGAQPAGGWSDPYAQGGAAKDTGWTDASSNAPDPGWTDDSSDGGGWTDTDPT